MLELVNARISSHFRGDIHGIMESGESEGTGLGAGTPLSLSHPAITGATEVTVHLLGPSRLATSACSHAAEHATVSVV